MGKHTHMLQPAHYYRCILTDIDLAGLEYLVVVIR